MSSRSRRHVCTLAAVFGLLLSTVSLLGYMSFFFTIRYGTEDGSNTIKPTTATTSTRKEVVGKKRETHSHGEASFEEELASQETIESLSKPSLKENSPQNNNPPSQNHQAKQQCTFREYPPQRHYGIPHHVHNPSTEPDFLKDASYIYGMKPTILETMDAPQKLCLNTTTWDPSLQYGLLPFSDGTNPSVVSIQLETSVKYRYRLKEEFLKPIQTLIQHHFPKATSTTTTTTTTNQDLSNYYLGVTTVSDGQCSWKETPAEVLQYKSSNLTKAPLVHTQMLLLKGGDTMEDGAATVVDSSANASASASASEKKKKSSPVMQTIAQAPLQLLRDAKWGKLRASTKSTTTNNNHNNNNNKPEYQTHTLTTEQLDDARLFYHNQLLWVLYRNGPKFGYDKQNINPVHFYHVKEEEEEEEWGVYIKASETRILCCGRNMAMISGTTVMQDANTNANTDTDTNTNTNTTTTLTDTKNLDVLAWVDPVTTLSASSPLSLMSSTSNAIAKQISSKKSPSSSSSSHIHGTNGFLLHLPTWNEWLGIAHFHRPEGRSTSGYARHGHHYTHAFYTIGRKVEDADADADGDGDHGGFGLRRLSREFVFASSSWSQQQQQQQQQEPQDPSQEQESPQAAKRIDIDIDIDQNKDADMIQFASGLDLPSANDVNGTLLISYGINDCEGAVVWVDMAVVQQMLREVEMGQEVVHLMEKPVGKVEE